MWRLINEATGRFHSSYQIFGFLNGFHECNQSQMRDIWVVFFLSWRVLINTYVVRQNGQYILFALDFNYQFGKSVLLLWIRMICISRWTMTNFTMLRMNDSKWRHFCLVIIQWFWPGRDYYFRTAQWYNSIIMHFTTSLIAIDGFLLLLLLLLESGHLTHMSQG